METLVENIPTENMLLENIFPTPFVIPPPLPKQAREKLPEYCPEPSKRNLATQYYFWNRELIKENREIKKKFENISKKNQKLRKKIEELENDKEDLKLERDRFLRIIFKSRRKNRITIEKAVAKPRTRQSYVRPLPNRIDEQREASLKQCPYCNGKLSKRIDFYQRTIEDIPSCEQQKVKVIKYTINRYYCKNCKKIVSAKPLDVLPRSRLGINTFFYVLYCKYRLRLTQGLIRENLKTYFNLNVSEGEINNLLNKGKQVFKNKWREIIESIRNSSSVNADETGWKINGEKGWLWAFAGDKAVRYTISECRGKGIPKQVLGENFNGVVGCDFYAAYNQFKNKQRCWVHLLRKIRELTEQDQTIERIKINRRLNKIYQEIVSFRQELKTTKQEREIKADLIKNKLIKISSIETKNHNLQKILNLCGKYSDELVVCVKHFNIPPENNTAERAIRPAVVARKISGGSRSRLGALIHETNLSVIETLRREGKQLFPSMKQLTLNYIASIG